MKRKDVSEYDESLNKENVIDDIIESESTASFSDVPKTASTLNSEDDMAPLDSLLYEDDESTYEPETTEEAFAFEDFLNEYKAHFSNTFNRENEENHAEAKKPNEKATAKPMPTASSSAPLKKAKSDYKSEPFDWSDEITLTPEVYESPDEDENIFRDTPLPEEEPEEVEFSIGTEIYQDEENEIQISIKFDESAEEKIEDVGALSEYRYDPEKPRIIDNIYDFLELFVITLVSVMILTTFVFRHSVVDGNSMQKTLSGGDSLIISDLFYTPERGDIVVLEDYSVSDGSLKKPLVKRIVGLPGETVEVKLNDKIYEVYINGELLTEEYAYNDKTNESLPTGIWELGDDEIFVMGDNRHHSRDSREIGPIKTDCILGKVVLRFYPFDKFGTVD